MEKGFTLIELLVVVLIIGILAAVALPQYNKAVLKARIAEYEVNLKKIVEAAEICKIEKGQNCNIDELSIEIPTCKPLPGLMSTCGYTTSTVYHKANKQPAFAYKQGTDSMTIQTGAHQKTTVTAISNGFICDKGNWSQENCKKVGFPYCNQYGQYCYREPSVTTNSFEF